MRRISGIVIATVGGAGLVLSANLWAGDADERLLNLSKKELNQETWGGDACAEWVLSADSIHGEITTAKAGTRSDKRIREQQRQLSLEGEAPSSAGYKMTEYLIDGAMEGLSRAELRRGVLDICRRYDPEYVRLDDAWRPNPEVRD